MRGPRVGRVFPGPGAIYEVVSFGIGPRVLDLPLYLCLCYFRIITNVHLSSPYFPPFLTLFTSSRLEDERRDVRFYLTKLYSITCRNDNTNLCVHFNTFS